MLLIILGTLLLALPWSHAPGRSIGLADALFTAASAICVTGLMTVPAASAWSVFGKIVLLLLIQAGGLSVITYYIYFLAQFHQKITYHDHLAIQAVFNLTDLNGLVRLVRFVLRFSLIMEGAAAVIMTVIFAFEGVSWARALFYGVFHAVSAFCSAGVDIIGDRGLENYVGHYPLNVTVMLLLLAGGLGFTVWQDIWQNFSQLRSGYRKPLQLQTRLALWSQGCMTVLAALLFYLNESENSLTLGQLPPAQKWLAAIFQAVSSGSAGFASLPQASLNVSTKIISSVIMLIGGAPGSTAGGIKTVTVAVVWIAVFSTFTGRRQIHALGKAISTRTLMRALAVIHMMVLIWFISVALIILAEGRWLLGSALPDLLYETASALGTVGLTTGLTTRLGRFARLVILADMFIGRIGPIALVMAMTQPAASRNERIEYPTENIMIG
ncbi:hypothetical protein HCH52_05560 [Oscillospiraceae bacterium HV4-5-C5C]|nr:hypothetical protein [Oscillospiraceae bacterium HV4-5-C5C]